MFFVRGHVKRVLKCVQRKHFGNFPNSLLRVTSSLKPFSRMEGLEGIGGAEGGMESEFHDIPSQGPSQPSQASYIRAPAQGLPSTNEHKASALKAEALQHLFIALVGSDCKLLWTLLVSFFGKGTGFDPFDFLDGAPIIKPPLDLGDTDSDEEASETASSVSLGSVSTTASTQPTQASTSTASPQVYVLF